MTDHPRGDWQPWETAWQAALYGPAGFYRRPEGPAGHFRTASHAAPRELAVAVRRLAAENGCTAVVDVGAGRGELLRALGEPQPGGHPQPALHGVDLVPEPADLPAGWSSAIDDVPVDAWRDALVIGWELLDVVPC